MTGITFGRGNIYDVQLAEVQEQRGQNQGAIAIRIQKQSVCVCGRREVGGKSERQLIFMAEDRT